MGIFPGCRPPFAPNGCEYERKFFSLKNRQRKIYFLYLLLYLVKLLFYKLKNYGIIKNYWIVYSINIYRSCAFYFT